MLCVCVCVVGMVGAGCRAAPDMGRTWSDVGKAGSWLLAPGGGAERGGGHTTTIYPSKRKLWWWRCWGTHPDAAARPVCRTVWYHGLTTHPRDTASVTAGPAGASRRCDGIRTPTSSEQARATASSDAGHTTAVEGMCPSHPITEAVSGWEMPMPCGL